MFHTATHSPNVVRLDLERIGTLEGMYVDSHCHLDDEAFDADRDEVVARARACGIGGFMLAGVDPQTWQRQRQLAATQRGFWWSAGLHPIAVVRSTSEQRTRALQALPECFRGVHAASALGETGLDARFVPRDSLEVQLEAFREQVAIARAHDVPLILHVLGRGTHLRAIEWLERDGVPRRGGVVHSFSGSAETVPQWLALGFAISFSGSVVRPAAERAQRAAAAVPLDRLLIETDSPDLAPPGRGPRNEPGALLDVAAALAKIHGSTPEAILVATSANARRLFGALET